MAKLMKPDLEQDLLRELFDYRDGNLYWKYRRNNGIPENLLAGSVNVQNDYIEVKINRKLYKGHRLVWIWHNGKIPEGYVIDHINMMKSDNHIENLRIVTHSENMIAANVRKRSTNKTGFVGVSKRPDNGKYRAILTKNGEKVLDKTFDTLEEAVFARQQAEDEYGFHLITNSPANNTSH